MGINLDCLLVDIVRLSFLLADDSSIGCRMLSFFLTTENLSIGVNEKLLSRRFNMDSPTGGLLERTSGNGRK